jgi:endonuclease YncB( thermonuclease family)
MLGAIVLTSFFIIDGDTIASDTNRIRLWGIDAPELYTQEGRDSRAFLEEYLHNQTLNCYSMGEDGYGRTVARCFDSYNVDVACALIQHGHAEEWHYFSSGYYQRNC